MEHLKALIPQGIVAGYTPEAIESIQSRAERALRRSPHFPFFAGHLWDYDAINRYQGFAWIDEWKFDAREDPSSGWGFELNYLCWFVTVCVMKGYYDHSCEFDNDLLSGAWYLQILEEALDDTRWWQVFRELKPFLAAYRILCDAKVKLRTRLLIGEYRYFDPAMEDPERHWCTCFLPVNLIFS